MKSIGAIATAMFVFGMVVTGALDMQKTAQLVQRVFITMLGGDPNQAQPTQSYETPWNESQSRQVNQ